MSIPQIQIRQQLAQLSIDADLGQYNLEQPRARIEMSTTQSKVEIRQRPGELSIDSNRAWEALGAGGHLSMMDRIYSQIKNIALQGIAKRNEIGNRLAQAAQTKSDPIPELAKEAFQDKSNIQYTGEASYDNVDITYIAQPAQIEFTPGDVNIQIIPMKPGIEYQRGKLDIYVSQKPTVEITPPQIDLKF